MGRASSSVSADIVGADPPARREAAFGTGVVGDATACQKALLELDAVFDGERTRPRRALATPPLQLSRARYDDAAAPGRLGLTVIHLGGVLAGDWYELNVTLAAGAQVVLEAAAATQIYTMSSGAARQQTSIKTAPGAALWWTPGPLILFAGARYCQATRIELAPGAFVMLCEILVPGRLARGECWRFAHYANTLEIVDAQETVLAAEHTQIEPARRSPAQPGVMAKHAVQGSLWLLGDRVDAERAAAHVGAAAATRSAAVLPGQSGVVVRALGGSLNEVRLALHQIALAFEAEAIIPARTK